MAATSAKAYSRKRLGLRSSALGENSMVDINHGLEVHFTIQTVGYPKIEVRRQVFNLWRLNIHLKKYKGAVVWSEYNMDPRGYIAISIQFLQLNSYNFYDLLKNYKLIFVNILILCIVMKWMVMISATAPVVVVSLLLLLLLLNTIFKQRLQAAQW